MIATIKSNHSVDVQTIKTISLQNFHMLHSDSYFDPYVKANQSDTIIIDTAFIIKDNKGRNALHFFRFSDGFGWNIISGDNRFFPVLAYNSYGSAMLDTSLNLGLKYWVEDILQQIDFMDKKNIIQSDALKSEWDKYAISLLSHSKNEPIDPTGCTESDHIWAGSDGKGITGLKWGQTAGFNHFMPADLCEPSDYYCNKYPSGCGPVAIGMVMKHYQRPVNYTINGTTKTANYSIMPNSIYWGGVNCSDPTSAQKETASLLTYASGKYAQLWCFEVSVPFYYSTKSATALPPNKIQQTFADFGFSNSGSKIDYSSNIQRLIDNLKLRKPVIFIGSNCDICFWNMHIWLCEGLKEHISESCSIYHWLYMNWGWN